MSEWSNGAAMLALAAMALGAIARAGAGDGTAFASAPPAEAGRPLPFRVTATTQPVEKPRPYMWVAPGCNMDFPLSSVRIGPEFWLIYANGDKPVVFRWKGTNVDDAEQQPNGKIAFPPEVKRPYLFGNMWYDANEGKLYSPVHCEFHRVDGFTREVHLARSADKGLTWEYLGPVLTRHNAGGTMTDMRQQCGQSIDGGPGDMHLFTDERGGFFYLYAHVWSYRKDGATDPELPNKQCRYIVARCPIADRMTPAKWRKFYNGAWTEPGVGGKASFVRAFSVMYNAHLRQYVSFNFESSIAVCDDLSKQDWTLRHRVAGDLWGTAPGWGPIFLDERKSNCQVAGRVLHVYTGFMGAKSIRTARLELGPGRAEAQLGYAISGGGYWGSPSCVSFEPSVDELYAVSPVLESTDPVQARRTRRCDANAVTLSADAASQSHWQEAAVPYSKGSSKGNPSQYSRESKITALASGVKGASISARFRAKDVYWRAFHDANSGKADVFVDDKLVRTVNLYSPTPTGLFMSFAQTGLEGDRDHTIRIVVRGDKGPCSADTTVKHRWFECSAETYRASDGFSAVMGKEQWHYLHGQAGRYEEMKFALERSGNRWTGPGQSSIGIGDMVPGVNAEAVRKWVAPRDGTVRVEGAPAAREPGQTLRVGILRNAEQIWPMQLPGNGHDLTVTVKSGEAIVFLAQCTEAKAGGAVLWDPRITYVDDEGASRSPSTASDQEGPRK